MNDKLKYFSYSQNSINTYKSCPLKFKYKYIDRINWKMMMLVVESIMKL